MKLERRRSAKSRGSLRVLWFSPTGKVNRVGQVIYGPIVIGTYCCGDFALVAKLNKIEKLY